jgi:hypothetical protein
MDWIGLARDKDKWGSKSKVILLPTVSRPVCLDVRHSSGTPNQFFPSSLQLFLDSCGFVDVGQVQVQVILRQTICRPVRLGARLPMGSMTRF